MKRIILVLILGITLVGCIGKEKSINTNIISKNEDIVYIVGSEIHISKDTKVKDVINNIRSEDGSKQKYIGNTNGKTEKEHEIFYDYEYLVVISENKKVKKYYLIVIKDSK